MTASNPEGVDDLLQRAASLGPPRHTVSRITKRLTRCNRDPDEVNHIDPISFILYFWVLPMSVGAIVASSKGRRGGWAWGLLLSWVGVVFVALLSNETPEHVATTEEQTQIAGMEAEAHVPGIRNREAS